jgi:short repeat uncharacterized protein DUF308
MAQSTAGRRFSGFSSRLDANGKGASFVMIGLEGIVLAAIALYMVITPDSARDDVRLIAGLVFVVAGCYQLQRAFSFYRANTHRSVVPVRFIGGSIMLFGGILIVLEKLTGHFNIDAARIVLASTLIAAGAFGLLAGLMGRRDGDMKLGNMVASVILLVLAGFSISEVRSGNDQTRTVGVIVLLLGLVMIGYAYLLRQQSLDQPAVPDQPSTYTPPAEPAPAASQPEPEPEPASYEPPPTAPSTATYQSHESDTAPWDAPEPESEPEPEPREQAST